MKISKLIDRYVSGRLERGEIVPLTAATLRQTLQRFAVVIDDPATREFSRDHIDLWLVRTNGLAASTKRTRLSCIRSFCEWAVVEGHLRRDPTAGVRSPRQPRQVPRALKRSEAFATFDAAASDLRSSLVLSLMFQEGLRRKEVAYLQVADIDFDERSIFIVGKAGHERFVWITDETLELLRAYLPLRGPVAGPLVLKKRGGGGLSPVTVGRLVSAVMYDAGVKHRAYDGKSAHAGRHTAATDMLRNGADIIDVQYTLGHATLNATRRYLPAMLHGPKKAMAGRSYRRQTRSATPIAS